MKNKFYFLAVSLLFVASMSAAPISPQEALSRLNMPATRGKAITDLKLTVNADNGEPTVYLFQNRDNDGYLVVSADNQITPLLGYSDFGSIDTGKIPDNLKWWLGEYSRQIEYARSLPASLNTRATIQLPDLAPIAPLVSTQWDQSAPFNNACPLIDGKRAVTGCVATSMSQVMNYFQYPAKGQGEISYQFQVVNGNDTTKYTQSLDFSKITFDWSNMIDNYSSSYTQAQADAVANLMVAAGTSVQMNYSPDSSGAYSGYIGDALINYFGYPSGISYLNRNWYVYSTWVQMIYDNLTDLGPVIYNGDSDSVGHSFICDGYAGDGYFHFNWGWGGMSDGYFLLDALNPSSLGTGGGLGGGFNFNQDALFGIRKPSISSGTNYGNPLFLYGSLAGESEGATIYFTAGDTNNPYVMYQGTGSITFDLGAKITNTTDPSEQPIYVVSDNFINRVLETGYYWPLDGSRAPAFDLSKVSLKNNKQYKVEMVYRIIGSNEWNPVTADAASFNYFYMTKKGLGSSSSFTIENIEPLYFTASDLSLESELYYNSGVKVSANITNGNDTELTRYVYLCLLSKTGSSYSLAFYGEGFMLTLAPGETLSKEWSTQLYNNTGTPVTKDTNYYLGLFDNQTGICYAISDNMVTMKPQAPDPVFTATLEVNDASKNGNGYVVPDASNFSVSTTINVESGYFNKALTLGVFEPHDDGYSYVVDSYNLGIIIIEAGNSQTLTTNVSFYDAEVNTQYSLGTYYSTSDGISLIERGLTPVIFSGNSKGSGVQEITMDQEKILFVHDRATASLNVLGGSDGIADVAVFLLNGMKAPVEITYSNGNALIDLSNLGKGIVVVTATDKYGNRKSIKLAL